MNVVALTAAALAIACALVLLELLETRPADRRAWLRDQAARLGWTVPVTVIVAVFTLAGTASLGDGARWPVVVGPAAAVTAFVVATAVSGRR